MSCVRCCVAAWIALSLGLAAAGPAWAQARGCGEGRDPGTGTLDEPTWRQLNAIFEDVGEEKYDQAHADLQRMMTRAGRDAYLQAILNQALAQVEWARGNYGPALRYFETAVALDRLPNETHFALMYQIAQLYFMQDRFDEALKRLELWFCAVPPERVTSAAYVLKASIHAQNNDFTHTLEAIDRAIAMDEDPKEGWYQVKLAAHYELEQYAEAAATLDILVSRWPDTKRYWTQLAQVHDLLGQGDRALAVMALAYRRNLLAAEGDFTYLANLYRNAGIPLKAAEVLEQGIRDGIVQPSGRHWALAADAWHAAEELERALSAYEEAGRAADDGGMDLRRGYILVDLERWSAALDALNRALDKGGLDDRKTGEAYLLRGMAQFNLGNLESAGADWGRAGRYERSRDAARQWMNHLQEVRQAPGAP